MGLDWVVELGQIVLGDRFVKAFYVLEVAWALLGDWGALAAQPFAYLHRSGLHVLRGVLDVDD